MQDVDVGITPLALQYLELNSTREEMWRHGYTIWAHRCECLGGGGVAHNKSGIAYQDKNKGNPSGAEPATKLYQINIRCRASLIMRWTG
jgi:hypothetical protein